MKNETDEERFKRLDSMRSGAKVVNYSALYGVGAKKLARESGIKVQEAEALLTAFWDLNWAIQKVAKDSYVKTLRDGTMWIKNPVSGFYYSLRYDRDKWSTINQGTGVYIFDQWVMRMRKLGVHPQLQYHDEVLLSVPKGTEGGTEVTLKKAMEGVNEALKLNITVQVDTQTGDNYAECH